MVSHHEESSLFMDPTIVKGVMRTPTQYMLSLTYGPNATLRKSRRGQIMLPLPGSQLATSDASKKWVRILRDLVEKLHRALFQGHANSCRNSLLEGFPPTETSEL